MSINSLILCSIGSTVERVTELAEITIDARGLKCPAPIMRLFVASKSAAQGDLLVATATDCAFRADAEAWCKKTGNTLEAIEEAGGEITARIRKK